MSDDFVTLAAAAKLCMGQDAIKNSVHDDAYFRAEAVRIAQRRERIKERCRAKRLAAGGFGQGCADDKAESLAARINGQVVAVIVVHVSPAQKTASVGEAAC